MVGLRGKKSKLTARLINLHTKEVAGVLFLRRYFWSLVQAIAVTRFLTSAFRSLGIYIIATCNLSLCIGMLVTPRMVTICT